MTTKTRKQKPRKQNTVSSASPASTASRPRIITLTVQRLRKTARVLKHAGWGAPLVTDLADWADELDAYDGRETKLDPSKKPRKTVPRR